jgi:hypothetical protein
MVDNVNSCYLPNAAIGWKQPNGFFYPPSFHSINLFFSNVDIRHYVIDALFNYGTYNENTTAAAQDYCPNNGVVSPTMFNSFTDIDRQTELSDDDGSLTGLINNWDPPNTTGTVSVNPTSFFTAPVQTNQCLSNVGVTPSLACQSTRPPTPTTAITSPYEYVTMAVYPQCDVSGTTDTSCPANCNPTTNDPSCTPHWVPGCSGPSCYGVPLYRQYLAGSDAGSSSTGEWMYWNTTDGCSPGTTSTACRWPFVRMGGETPPSYQRSTLTANNGTYFLDTSVGATQQSTEPFTSPAPGVPSNVFQAGQTYYVYFLYAKPDTVQTVQVYVGPGFNLSTGLQGIRVYPQGWPLSTSNVTLMGNLPPSWGWGSSYDGNILTVTTNFSALSDIVPSPANGLCLPSSFCTASGSSCGCTLTSTDPLYNQCQQACSHWAVKDLDYPPAGAYGFAFTLPAGFTTTTYNANALGSPSRPAPTPFPTTQTNPNGPDWTSLFLNTTVSPDNASGGQCYYPNLPSNLSSSCPVIYPNPTSN